MKDTIQSQVNEFEKKFVHCDKCNSLKRIETADSLKAWLTQALTQAEQRGREEERKQLLRQMDVGDNDYLTARRAVAQLSGIPAMAITFDEHLKVIEDKLHSLKDKE